MASVWGKGQRTRDNVTEERNNNVNRVCVRGTPTGVTHVCNACAAQPVESGNVTVTVATTQIHLRRSNRNAAQQATGNVTTKRRNQNQTAEHPQNVVCGANVNVVRPRITGKGQQRKRGRKGR